MLTVPLEIALLVIGTLLLTTVIAGTLTSRFGLPALIGFLGLGMLAGVDGPGAIAFSDYQLTQGVGVACLIFILFSGGMDTSWKSVRPMVRPALVLATFGVLISALGQWLFRNVPPALPIALAMTEGHEKAQRRRIMEEHGCTMVEAAYKVAEQLAEARA